MRFLKFFFLIICIGGLIEKTYAYNAAGVLGQPDFTSNTPGTAPNKLYWPQWLASENDGLWVVDSQNNRILFFNASNGITSNQDAVTVIGQPNMFTSSSVVEPNGSNFGYPQQLFMDGPDNPVFLADWSGSRVLMYQYADFINGRSAIHVLGQPNFSTNTPSTSQNRMRYPRGVYFDTDSQLLFVAESNNNRILVYDLSGGVEDGMNAVHVLGQINFTSSTSGLAQNKFAGPHGLSYDSVRKLLFLTDSDNHRVLVFDLSSGISDGMNATYVFGQPNFTTRTISTSRFREPRHAEFIPSLDVLLVADSLNNRVLGYNLSSGISNGMSPSFVLGQINFASDTIATTQSGMYSPRGIAFDEKSNRLYIAEMRNHRVVWFDLPFISASSTYGIYVNEPFSLPFLSETRIQGIATSSLIAGTLPEGTILSTSTISGIPTQIGKYIITIKGGDDLGEAGVIPTAPKTITLNVVTRPASTSIPISLDSGTQSVVLSSSQDLILNTSNTLPLNIAVAPNSSLNLSLFVTSTPTSTQVALPSSIKASFLNLSLAVPSGTIFFAPAGWNGIFALPTPLATSSVSTSSLISQIIEVGSPFHNLTSNRAVRLFFQTSDRPAYLDESGNIVPITTLCSADTQEAADLLPEAGDCFIPSGSGLAIWTKHFSKFLLYSSGQTVMVPAAVNSPTQNNPAAPSTTPFSTSSLSVSTPPTTETSASSSVPTPSSTIPAYRFSKPLALGSRGEEVRQLQLRLIQEQLLAPDLATAYFGKLTRAAVQKYQIKYQIVKDPQDPGYGRVGPKTRRVLNGR